MFFFQTKSLMAHKLRDLQLESLKKFLSCFMRPEKIPDKLTDADIRNPACCLPIKEIYIGSIATKSVTTATLERVMTGYVSAAELTIKKLPVYKHVSIGPHSYQPYS